MSGGDGSNDRLVGLERGTVGDETTLSRLRGRPAKASDRVHVYLDLWLN